MKLISSGLFNHLQTIGIRYDKLILYVNLHIVLKIILLTNVGFLTMDIHNGTNN